MQSAPHAIFPPLHETRHSRESLVKALSHEVVLPSTEVAVAVLYAQDIEPDFLAVIERACQEELDSPSARLFFRGLHILGGRRFTSAYRPLVAFLRGPQDRIDDLLGDAKTETLTRILAGMCDGDEKPLQSLITDMTVNSFVREAALNALGFLVFDGRVDRTAFEAFLLRLEKLLPPDDDVLWHGWMTMVAVLGMSSLVPLVRAAFADGRISPAWCDEDDFDGLLQAAIERPNDPARLADENMGYIDDVLVALEQFHFDKDDFSDKAATTERWQPGWADWREPARNPFRGVGRNDPCPCGSGKKAKKCCLQ